jgi:hypothetical protein
MEADLALNVSVAGLSAALFLISGVARGASPGKVIATAQVDGFTVNIVSSPTIDRLPRPTKTAGNVYAQMGSVPGEGTDPFANYPKLAGVSPYLSIQPGGTVTFLLKTPASSIMFVWGTPDGYNTVTLYDTTGAVIGTINGADYAGALGGANGQFAQIVSPVLIGKVVGASGYCCFEFSDASAH